MATSFYLKQKREYERMLARLEKKYDNSNSHLRQFMQDRLDIQKLVKEKVIDHAHGELLYERAKVRYEQEEFRLKGRFKVVERAAKMAKLWFAIIVVVTVIATLGMIKFIFG